MCSPHRSGLSSRCAASFSASARRAAGRVAGVAMAPAEAPPGGGMPRVATFSRPLATAGGDGSDGQGNTPGGKPGGEGSFTSSMEGTFHAQDPQAMRMHRIAELLFYCSVGNLKAVKKLVDKEKIDLKNPVDSGDYDRRTPLHLAASDGSYAVAHWLLTQKVPLNHVDRFGFTPLEGAVRGKHKELVLLLKEAGGRVMHNGFLVELEASALAGAVTLNVDPETNGEMDWGIPENQIGLTGILGEGAFGTVHKGKWRGTPVAVKTLKRLANATADKVAMAEFRTELALIQHLHHPHVVQFLGVMRSAADGAPLLVTEYMELGSLADWFKKPTGLAPHVAIDLCLDCCRGMTYLHGRSPNPVLHRDLKPNNLMITVGMRLKIGDFGLSKTLSVRNRLPQDMSQAYKLTGETGSYRFMAPEVFRHEYYGPPVDVYAFSMVAYQMYHNQVPFEGMTPVDAARAASYERRRPVLAPHLAKELADVIRDCWQPNPNSRPTFEDVITRLTPLRDRLVKNAPDGDGCCVVQ